MTLKEFAMAMKTAVVTGGKKIVKALLNANIVNICKVGILIGSAALTVIAVLRYMKQKRRVYSNEEGKSTTDRALQLNYSDLRNLNELHPMMHDVKKRLTKDLKPRNGKKYKVKGKKRSFWYDDDDKKSSRSNTKGPVALQELKRFQRDMEIIDRERLNTKPNDGFSLRNTWLNS